ncbi:unnamed protein product [Thelazia callipaeda]|uniref:BLOC-1-related complex subunit 7 n=1 Tax=Thelazia callipaeda TaxID=103827 RepID=A0A0N5CQ65_THECL|nr:unnamed protein product [Thelazia callipaeda]
MEVNGGNTNASSCDINCNAINNSSRPIDQLSNGWKRVSEGSSTSQLKDVGERSASLPEPGISRMITVEIIIRGIEEQAHAAIISIAGRPYLQRRFLEKSTKRIEAQDTHFEKNTLHESKGAEKCMRSMSLMLALKRDCLEALSMLTERMGVYENKIKVMSPDVHSKFKTPDFSSLEGDFIEN